MVFKSWPSIQSSPSRQSMEPHTLSDDEGTTQPRACGGAPLPASARARPAALPSSVPGLPAPGQRRRHHCRALSSLPARPLARSLTPLPPLSPPSEAVDLFARTHSQQSDAIDEFEGGWLSRRTSGISNASPAMSPGASSITSAAATPKRTPATAAPAAAPSAAPAAAATAAAAQGQLQQQQEQQLPQQSTPASPGALMAQLSELVLVDSEAAEQRHSQRQQDGEALSPASQQQQHDDAGTVSTADEALLKQHTDAATPVNSPYSEPPLPKYTIDDQGLVSFEYDSEYIGKKYQVGVAAMMLCWRSLALAGAAGGARSACSCRAGCCSGGQRRAEAEAELGPAASPPAGAGAQGDPPQAQDGL
jgi:hypothetical protein